MRPVLAALALAAVAGCGPLPQPAVQPAPVRTSLEAYILPLAPSAPLSFDVSRAAYVALFSITPGAGVSMLYPSLGSGPMDGRAFSGITAVHGRPTNLQTYSFAGLNTGPRFLFLIASERPLDLEQFGTLGIGLRSRLGQDFFSSNPYDTMMRLAELSLPTTRDDGTWASDLYVDWPNVIYSTPQPRMSLVLVQCGGRSAYVQAAYLSQATRMLCMQAMRATTDSPHRTGRDSSTAAQPPRRPVKPEPRPRTTVPAVPRQQPPERVSVREKILESHQLGSDAGARRPGEPRALPADRPRLGRPGERVVQPRARGSQGSSVEKSSSSRGGSRASRSSGSASSGAGSSASSPSARPAAPAAAPSAPAASGRAGRGTPLPRSAAGS